MGNIIYDGKVNIRGKGPFNAEYSLTEGPFLNKQTHKSIVISFVTSHRMLSSVECNGKIFRDNSPVFNHEMKIDDLRADSNYNYNIIFAGNEEEYSFKTAPNPGSRKAFSFGFTSDSRAGKGGGERNIHGVNAYVMKRITALARQKNISFMQFTGDMINGYTADIEEARLQYSNWKRTIEAYAAYAPVNVGIGNHEVLQYIFGENAKYAIDKFPFSNNSSEYLFSEMFVNPENGPKGEDDNKYDPNPEVLDFPLYNESVYYYTYDNTAMIVLNSNSFYAENSNEIKNSSGNLHAYIMDNQLKWLDQTIEKFELDNNIDHIFITLHTPIFPNGGHSGDDMWYGGDNSYRPYISGKAVDKGIIERRDEILDILINKSKKTLAVLCGDEHNYSRMKINSKSIIYPEKYKKNKLKISRPLWQITNGSAGAPYYGQEKLPWSDDVIKFSSEYALVFFNINGKEVEMEVVNPLTLEVIEKVNIRR